MSRASTASSTVLLGALAFTVAWLIATNPSHHMESDSLVGTLYSTSQSFNVEEHEPLEEQLPGQIGFYMSL